MENEQERPSSWFERRSFLRDVLVQTVGTLLAALIIAAWAVAWGFIQTPQSSEVLRGTIAAIGVFGGLAGTIYHSGKIEKGDSSRRRYLWTSLFVMLTVGAMVWSFSTGPVQ